MKLIDGDRLYKEISGRQSGYYVSKMLLKEMISKAPKIKMKSIEDAWVDCYNRLPEKNDYYLITVRTGSYKQNVTVFEAYYRNGKWEYNQANQDDVVAWMKYPDPYDG